MVAAAHGDAVTFLCLECLESSDVRPMARGLVCSVEGCGEVPDLFADLADDLGGRLYLCSVHFVEVEGILVGAPRGPGWTAGVEVADAAGN
jgi:hypothetical protein